MRADSVAATSSSSRASSFRCETSLSVVSRWERSARSRRRIKESSSRPARYSRSASSSATSPSWRRAASAWRSRGRNCLRTSRCRSWRRSRFCSLASRRRSARPAPTELENAGRLLDHHAPVLGTGLEDRVELALADDHVLLAADSCVGEKLLDVEQAAGGPIERVLALARAKQRPGDRYLCDLDRQTPRSVVDRERHLGSPEGGPLRGAGEDDIVHFRGPDNFRALGAEHPGHGVDHVRLARTVRPDHNGDTRLELDRRGIGKGLEPFESQRL